MKPTPTAAVKTISRRSTQQHATYCIFVREIFQFWFPSYARGKGASLGDQGYFY